MKSKTKKRLCGGVALLSTAALLLTGTFAWKDFRQHSLNKFEGKNNPDVTLNDEFAPPQSWNTTVNSVVDKKVSVTNTANSSAPVFVRIQFSEYMESFTVDYEQFIMDTTVTPPVPVLFATYASGPQIGEYLVWDTQAEAQAGLASLGLALPTYAVDHDNDPATPDKWYARTVNEELQNGVYGKPMNDPAETQTKTRAKLFGNVERQNLKQDIQPTPFPYKPHTWDGKSINDSDADPFYDDIGDDAKNTISDYIAWDMGADTKTYAKWVQDGKRAEAQWVLAEDGWCYWATFLPVNTTTSMLMESVRLIQMPDDAMDYEIHIDMQAITQEELIYSAVWTEMSAEMRESLKNTVPAMMKMQELQALINDLKARSKDDYTPESWLAMKTQLDKAEILAADTNAKYDDLVNQIAALTAARTGLVMKASKTSLQTLIGQVEVLEKDNYSAASWSFLQEKLAKAKIVMNNTNATQQEVNTAYTDLSTAKEGLVPVSERAGLIAAINEASQYQQKDWSATTWATFNAKLVAAITVRDNTSATPAQIQTALSELVDAQLALRADKTKLQTLIDEVKAFDSSAISPASWNKVANALNAANTVNDTATSKQSEVDAAWSALQKEFLRVNPPIGALIRMTNGEEWRVLDVKDGKTLIISEKILSQRRFHSINSYPTWRDSEMRGYVNSAAFLNNHFTAEEQARITTTDVKTATAVNNPTEITTQDKLFLLSKAEAFGTQYFASNADRVGRLPNGNPLTWWLRSPCSSAGADSVYGAGTFEPNYATNTIIGVRPALWLKL